MGVLSSTEPQTLNVSEGDMWSLIRSGLAYCRDDIKGAAGAQQYEVESAYFDHIARTIASYIMGDIRAKITEAEAAIDSRMRKPEPVAMIEEAVSK